MHSSLENCRRHQHHRVRADTTRDRRDRGGGAVNDKKCATVEIAAARYAPPRARAVQCVHLSPSLRAVKRATLYYVDQNHAVTKISHATLPPKCRR